MEPIIIVRDLVQKIGRNMLLNGISFDVLPGESFGVFGVRGAGKTTLLHILAGIDRFKSGQVEVLGCNITKSENFKRNLGIVTQESSLFLDMTVGENLDFIAALKNASRADVYNLIERYELNDSLSEPVTVLTLGIFQRLSLACAMLNRPKLLIADEIIKDFDLYSRNLILRELRQFQAEGGTCVYGFSNIEFCEHMSKVGWLESGQMNIYEPKDAQTEWNRQVKFYTEQSDRHHV
ncbi:ATP-binding cassette domain-containing protein [Desulfoscipio gibsoniae]|uniref:ABC-type multidrug transport system, ATPase component n=1 Tax=Desulfoscipio gibsoniae DSM 7213 TaxID=767817 RepID=R4KNN9_9FIRM|nr:ABC transporter ATP-binding protein [Desulfoscipio gibsoniae]AGL02165.1 ABC-type multidrug transport system, ATPase component [Desulfoscipio gibsoniae DSM 7213]